MKLEKWFPLAGAGMCIFVMAVFWMLGLDAAENPDSRPWFMEWWVAVIFMQASGVTAFQFLRIWIDDRRLERRYGPAGVTTMLVVIVALLGMACGHNSLTAPDGGEVKSLSALGFRIEAYNQEFLDSGGSVTSQHGELADRWWTELMMDLRAAGYPVEKTDPKRNAEWVYVYLHRPVDSDSSIVCPPTGAVVGGYYDQFKPAFHVPGDYINGPMLGRRPSSQPLKHEMLHHWCMRTLGHFCLERGKSEWEGHHHAAPDGTDIWLFTWK